MVHYTYAQPNFKDKFLLSLGPTFFLFGAEYIFVTDNNDLFLIFFCFRYKKIIKNIRKIMRITDLYAYADHDAYIEYTHKELICTQSIRVRDSCVHWAYA